MDTPLDARYNSNCKAKLLITNDMMVSDFMLAVPIKLESEHGRLSLPDAVINQ
jgi:hypothetical protein